ncbi:LicD family protein [Streptococcus pneumoniae]
MDRDFTVKEIQELEFEILKYLKEVCEKNNLRYYLAYGTLIGAVRHKDIIPWDDDIDVMLPREDYKKLVQILTENPHPYYKIISVDTNSKFQVPLPKLVDTRTILIQDYDIVETVPLGLYVDLFLIDGGGDNFEESLLHYNEAFNLYKKWKKSRLKLFPTGFSKVHGFLRWVKNIYFKVRGSCHYMKMLEEHNSKYSFYHSKYVATLETGTSDANKCIWKYEDFGEGVLLELRGEVFNVPNNYAKILESEYGNYMELPPEEKRQSHHSYHLKWNEHFAYSGEIE